MTVKIASACALALSALIPVSTLAETTSITRPPEPPRFRTTVMMDLGSNLYAVGSPEHSASASFVLIPSWRWTSSWNVGMLVSSAKDLTGDRQFTVYDPSLQLSHAAVPLNPYLRLMSQFALAVPATARSRERDSLITAARSAFRFVGDLSRIRKRVIRDMNAMFEISTTRAFHQYSTSSTGAPNTEWKLSNWVSLGYAPDSPWSFSADFIRNTGWSYQGGARHSFSLGETLTYQVDPAFSISIGHTNEGDVLRANGISSNIQVFDPTSSRFFTSFMVIF